MGAFSVQALRFGYYARYKMPRTLHLVQKDTLGTTEILPFVPREMKEVGQIQWERDGLIKFLYVEKEFRRRGWGSRLLEKAEYDVRKRTRVTMADSLYMNPQIVRDKEILAAFLKKHDFRDTPNNGWWKPL